MEKKWTIIDRPTQIISLSIIIVGCIIIGIILANFLIFPFLEEESNLIVKKEYDSRFFGTWINSSSDNSEYPSSFVFYKNGTCVTPNGNFNWYVKKILEKDTGYDHGPIFVIDNLAFSYSKVHYDGTYGYTFTNDNNTLRLYYLESITVYYEKL